MVCVFRADPSCQYRGGDPGGYMSGNPNCPGKSLLSRGLPGLNLVSTGR